MIGFSYGAVGWPFPLCKIVQLLAELGFDGIEGFGLTEMLPQDEQFLSAVLRETSLKFPAFYFACSFIEEEKFDKEISDFHDSLSKIKSYGGTHVVLAGGHSGMKSSERWPVFVSKVQEFAEIADSYKILTAFHPHAGTMVFSSKEIEYFLAETDPRFVRLTLDTAHLAWGGADILETLDKYFHRVAMVHLKDSKKEFRDRFLELGQGDIPIKSLCNYLKSKSFNGWITTELDSSSDAFASAKRNRDYLRDEVGIGSFVPKIKS
jgi:inosose dehydratase